MIFTYLCVFFGIIAIITVFTMRNISKVNRSNVYDLETETGIFTFLSVTERPLEPDANGDAYCAFKGEITGPSIPNDAPVQVFTRTVRKFNQLWPEVGQQASVAYLPGKVKNSWCFVNMDLEG